MYTSSTRTPARRGIGHMTWVVLYCAALIAASNTSAQSTPVAVVDATIVTISGDVINSGTLLVHNGKIVSIGSSVALPANTQRIDAKGKWVMPGLIDTHSHIGGAGGADGSAPIQPSVRVYDSLSPFDPGFRRAVAGGLTTLNIMPGSGHLLSGQTVYVKLRKRPGSGEPGASSGTLPPARKIDDYFILNADGSPSGGMKMANGTNSIGNSPFPGTRAKSAALMREQFVRAQEYKAKITSAGQDVTKLPPRDLALEALSQVLDGTRVVHYHTHRADDIMTVLRLKREFNFKVVLHHVSEAWKVAPELAKEGIPCSAIVVDAPGGKLEAAELSWENGAILEKAGVATAFHTDDWITDSRLFLRSAGIAVRAGMTREGALRALTIEGARMLDLQNRIGSLEPGKDADFIILSGDPLSVYTKVEQTWVEGTKVFDRSDNNDYLYAVGGFGAGNPTRPYMCCSESAYQSGAYTGQ